MKKLFIPLLIIFGLQTGSLQAQYYSFDQFKTEYHSINEPDFSITDIEQLDTLSAYLTVNYEINDLSAFGEKLTGLMQAGPDGSLVAIGEKYDFIFDPFFTDLRPTPISEFRAIELVENVDTFFEIEWYKFGLVGASNRDMLTMKCRFYLSKELIEFHFGRSNVPIDHIFPYGPFCGLFHATKGFNSYVEVMAMAGDPEDPDVVVTTGKLSGFPSNGTVYRYRGPGVYPTGQKESPEISFEIFPNPANETVNIRSHKLIEQIQVFNQLGKLVLNLKDVNRYEYQLNLPFPKGHYIIQTTFENDNIPGQQTLMLK